VQHRFPHAGLNVAFRVAAGIVVLFGPSGAGKTLTLRTIAGLFRPQKGVVRLEGETWLDTAHGVNRPPQARRVGYVPQHLGLFPHLSVRENIAFGLHAMPGAVRRQRVEEALALMHLEEVARQRPDGLSGGQQQRVALARALVTRPRILLLDEAFSHLDPVLRSDLGQAVRQIHRRFHLPVVLITHDLDEAYALADRLVVLEAGQVVQTGTQDEIFHHPATLRLARAVGMRNLFPVTVQGHSLETTQLRWAGGLLQTPRVALPAGTRVWAGIRPEDVLFVRDSRPLKHTHNLVEAQVAEVHPAGASVLVLMKPASAPEQPLWVRLPPVVAANLGLRPGLRRVLLLRQRGLHVFSGENAPPLHQEE